MNKIRERLSTSRSFMKIRALSSESVCRRHRLPLEAVPADGAAQHDLTQRRHGILQSSLLMTGGNFCATLQTKVVSLMPLLSFSCQRIFSHPEARCALLLTRDLVVDADQPAA